MANNYSNQYNMLDFYTKVIAPKYLGFDNADNYRIGIFGHINELFAISTEDNANMVKTLFPEIFPNKAELPESIMTYASLAKFTDIHANPSGMTMMVAMYADELHDAATFDMDGTGTYIIDKQTTNIKIADINFMLDYNVRMTMKKTNANNEYVYSAIYDMNEVNNLSDLTNPYIKVLQTKDGNRDVVMIEVMVRQIKLNSQYIKIISEQTLDNIYKIIEFDGDLADFNIYYKGPNDSEYRYINKLMDGEYEIDDEFCYYSFLDTNKISLRFIAKTGYFVPEFNGELKVDVYTTKGSSGSFIYTNQSTSAIQDASGTYTPITLMPMPLSNSDGGVDKQELDIIRRKVSEMFSVRGVIVMESDLQNYFNSFQDNNYIYFSKLRDDVLYRIYSAYMLMRDSADNIIHTNTVSLKISEDDTISGATGKAVIPTVSAFKFDDANEYVVPYTGNDHAGFEKDNFLYSNPLLISLTENPTMVNLYTNHINRNNYIEFEYINTNSLLQMIASQVQFKRDIFSAKPNTYELTVRLKKNIDDTSYHIIDDNGQPTDLVKTRCILYDSKDNSPLGWADMDFQYYDEDNDEYVYKTLVETRDEIDNFLQIPSKQSLKTPGTNTVADIKLPIEKVTCKVVTYVKENIQSSDGLGSIIPEDPNYSVTNIYTTTSHSHIDFMINMTDIMRPKFRIEEDPDTHKKTYVISSLPVIRHSYINNSTRLFDMIRIFREKKLYLLDAAAMVQNAFSIDMKLYNTYGPSIFYNIGINYESLDRLDLSIEFRLRLIAGTDYSVVDTIREEITTYVENLNGTTSNINLYIDNLLTDLKNKYNQIQHIQFVSINGKDSSYQSVESKFDKDTVTPGYIPEFLNVKTDYDKISDRYMNQIKITLI